MKARNILSQTAFWQINKALASKVGVEPALLLAELVGREGYFDNRDMLIDINGEDYFFCTSQQLTDVTTLSYRKQKRCIKTLEDTGMIKTFLRGVPAKVHFSICDNNIVQCVNTSISETQSSVLAKRKTCSKRNAKTINNNKEIIIDNNNKVIKEREIKESPILSKEILPKKSIKSKNIIVDRTGEVFLESVEANELFLSFLEDRDENPKVKNSPTAIKVLVNKLKDKLSIVQIEMIENSIVSGYPNLYEPRIKNNYNKNNAKQATTNMRDRFGDDTDKVMQGILDGTRKPFQVDIPTEVTIIKKLN